MSHDSTMRMQALISIHGRLRDMILDPPRRTGRHKDVDVNLVRNELNEIKPFWHAYLNTVKPTEGYNFNNMIIDERNMYLACMFWYGMLDAITKVDVNTPTLAPIQGGTA